MVGFPFNHLNYITLSLYGFTKIKGKDLEPIYLSCLGLEHGITRKYHITSSC